MDVTTSVQDEVRPKEGAFLFCGGPRLDHGYRNHLLGYSKQVDGA